MRIAYNGWFWSQPEVGSGQYTRHLVTVLGRLYPECELIVLLPNDVDPEVPLNLENVTFVSRSIVNKRIGKVWWEQVTVPGLAQKLGADVLHIPYWAPPFQSAIPTVVTVHDLIPMLLPEYRGGLQVQLYTSLVRATSSRADLLLTDSDASRQDIIRHLRVQMDRVQAIYLATDLGYGPESAPDDLELLAAFGLTPGYILYLGGFNTRKNVKTVIEAFARVQNVIPQARLVIAGKLPKQDSDFAPDPRKQAIEAGISENIYFTDLFPESAKPALYRCARVFVFPSFYEGFGLPPLEALSCGVPVVGSNASSLPEVVGDAGVLVAPTDVVAMADALIRLLSDDSVFAQYSQRALVQAARFSWETTAQATYEAYRTICEVI